MTNRAAKFLSAISASLVVSVPIATIPVSMVYAADECVTAREGEAPAGLHAYDRLDRDTNHHCLHLRANRATSSRATRSAPTPRAEAHASATLPRATADARDESPSEHSELADGAQASPLTPIGPSSIEQGPANQGLTEQGLANQGLANQGLPNQDPANNVARENARSVVASRWPEPMEVLSSAGARLTSSSFAVASATPDANADRAMDADLTSEAPSAAPTRAKTSIFEAPASIKAFLLAAFGVITLTSFAGSIMLMGRLRRRPQPKPARPVMSVSTRPPRWLGATAADDDADVPLMFRPVTDAREAREWAQQLARRTVGAS
jgi:hypothetical protein